MHRLKIISEEIKFDKRENSIEGKFTLSNKQEIFFTVSPGGYQQWGASKEELYLTVDRLEEIKNFYFGICYYG